MKLEEVLKDVDVLFKGDKDASEMAEFWVLQKKNQEVSYIRVDRGTFRYPSDGGTYALLSSYSLNDSPKWFRRTGELLKFLRAMGKGPGHYRNYHAMYDWAMKEWS